MKPLAGFEITMAATCCKCSAPAMPAEKSRPSPLRHLKMALAILLAGLSMTLTLGLNLDPPDEPLRTIFHGILATITGAGLVFLGWPVLRGAWVPRLTLEHLYLIGLAGAYAASLYSSWTGIGHIYYEVVLILLAIYHTGSFFLESRTREAGDLASHVPGLATIARRIARNGVDEVPAADIRAGQRVRVEAGEFMPVDGVICDGRAFVEELAHTGEPFPAVRGPGDSVLAGARVLDGTLGVDATADGRDRELDRLLAACRAAEPSPTEHLARRVLAWFVPAVVTVALATWVYWTWPAGDPAAAWFNALAVTIVACPCALGLAVPLASRTALMQLRMRGLIPHQPDVIERLAKVDAVAFDKTGTLSHPRLGLERLEARPGAPAGLPAWIAAIQRQSTHPVARPFWNLTTPAELEDLQIRSLPALGIEARFTHEGNRHTLRIGNEQLRENAPQAPDAGPGRKLIVMLDGKWVATAHLAEAPRDSAAATLDALRDHGIDRLLLTGDTSCPAVYQEAMETHTGLTTAAKAAMLRDMQEQGRRILFVGDGLNDSEGLANAHVGVALRSGSESAQATARATLAHDDLSILPGVIRMARGMRTRLVRLLTFSLAYNAIGITMAATGLLHPVAAALLMFASSITVLVVVNRQHDSCRQPPVPQPNCGERGCR